MLAPSERCNRRRGKPHKRPTDWAGQGILQTCRWLPDRRVVFVGDNGFAVLDLLAAVRHRCTVVSRLRLDANLYAPPPARGPRTLGRPASKGRPLPKLKAVAEASTTVWRRIVASEWYGDERCELDITSGTGMWYRPGSKIVPLRWVLVRDPSGARTVQAFFSTDLDLSPEDILAFFVRRWQVEVTFAEVRAHLGVETQRQWSDLAILRTTPALLGLYSLVTLWADDLLAKGSAPYAAAWYTKTRLTFSDAIAAIRMQLWIGDICPRSASPPDQHKIPPARLIRMAQALCYPA
ncbi:transposase [Mesorhizobium sp. M1340]|uniref:IS701 family transposase n=1 Tax=Mesorhizobium sp. M1340 TaxID=2957087 RepID=UPI0033390EB0